MKQALTVRAAGDRGSWLTGESEACAGWLRHLEQTVPGAPAGGGVRGERFLLRGFLRQREGSQGRSSGTSPSGPPEPELYAGFWWSPLGSGERTVGVCGHSQSGTGAGWVWRRWWCRRREGATHTLITELHPAHVAAKEWTGRTIWFWWLWPCVARLVSLAGPWGCKEVQHWAGAPGNEKSRWREAAAPLWRSEERTCPARSCLWTGTGGAAPASSAASPRYSPLTARCSLH